MANSSFRTSPMEFLRSVEVVFARSQLPRPRHPQHELCCEARRDGGRVLGGRLTDPIPLSVCRQSAVFFPNVDPEDGSRTQDNAGA